MVKVLIPSGALGIGFDPAALAAGVAARPDIIAIDGGSTDSGPHYLGTGTSKYARSTVKAEWSAIMAARAEAGVPLVIGTAGTSGADSAVDWLLDITREIAEERGSHERVAVLKSGQQPAAVVEAMNAGRVTPLSGAPDVHTDTVGACSNIVALAGAEAIQYALDADVDIVIAGRTTDTALIAALPLARGCNPGAAWHGAKIGECGALATTHPDSGTLLVSFDETGFTVTPMGADAAATPRTVSAHMLYENSDPIVLHEPGGYLDVSGARYEAVDARSVRVTGSKWVVSDTYTVKLEGARIAGYQTASMVLLRDARYVARVHEWTARIEELMQARLAARGVEGATIELRVIGQNATLGALETRRSDLHEVGVLAVVTAPDQSTATDVAKSLNPLLLHCPLSEDEPMPTFAFPFSPPEMQRGPVYEFCLHHVLTLDAPCDAFRREVVTL
ncbi:MAG: acyclic terpene utilization AtuA family protein [Pseudomonadota bacterium]